MRHSTVRCAAYAVKLAFHDANTETDTYADILVDFRARIVHEPDTHEDPRLLVRHAARRGSSRRCPLGVCACTRVLYTISYRVHVYKITRIGASLMSLSVSVSVSVPWNSSSIHRRIRQRQRRTGVNTLQLSNVFDWSGATHRTVPHMPRRHPMRTSLDAKECQ